MPDPDKKVIISFAQATDKGQVQEKNQDAIYSFWAQSSSVSDYPSFGIFAIADGTGDDLDGEKASEIAVHTVVQEMLQNIYMPLIRSDDMSSDNHPEILDALVDGIRKTDSIIREQAPNGRAVVIAVTIQDDIASLAKFGIIRAYIITRDGGIERITRDYSPSLVSEWFGDDKENERLHHSKALGHSEEVEVNVLTRRLPPNSHLFLCSSGLWSMVSDEEMYETVMSTPDLKDACKKLVALANENGGTDNISVILIKVSEM